MENLFNFNVHTARIYLIASVVRGYVWMITKRLNEGLTIYAGSVKMRKSGGNEGVSASFWILKHLSYRKMSI